MRKVKVNGERWKVVGEYGHAYGRARIFCQDLETVAKQKRFVRWS